MRDIASTDQLIATFIETWLAFDLRLRETRGLDERMEADLLGLLASIAERLAPATSIPKSLASVFLDMWGAMTSCAGLYDSGTQQRIFHAADRLTDAARAICAG